jgi:hypothetical protein
LQKILKMLFSHKRGPVSTANGWKRSSTVAFSGTKALQIFASSQTAGNPVSAVTPRIDLRGANPSSTFLVYRYAAARRTSSNTDVFKVYTSINCGRSFAQRVSRLSANGPYSAYTTTTNFAGTYRPQASDWRREQISLSNVAGKENVLIKFELTPGGGNNFYIDSVAIIDTLAVGNAVELSQKLALVPNPASEETTLWLSGSGPYQYTITDVMGKVHAQASGRGNRAVLPIAGWAAGTYMVRVWQGDTQRHQRLVVLGASR